MADLEQHTFTGELDEDEVRNLLQERARKCAAETSDADQDEQNPVLLFSLAEEQYGVELCHVREMSLLKHLTPLPKTPGFLAGVTNLRGRIVAVIDLRHLFGLPVKGLTELNRLIVLSDDTSEFALLADSVQGIEKMSLSGLQTDLQTLTGTRDKYLMGVSEALVVVLDGKILLQTPELKLGDSEGRA